MEELQEATARLEAEIEAIKENIRQTEGLLLGQIGCISYEQVLNIRHLYFLRKACVKKRLELIRLLAASL